MRERGGEWMEREAQVWKGTDALENSIQISQENICRPPWRRDWALTLPRSCDYNTNMGKTVCVCDTNTWARTFTPSDAKWKFAPCDTTCKNSIWHTVRIKPHETEAPSSKHQYWRMTSRYQNIILYKVCIWYAHHRNIDIRPYNAKHPDVDTKNIW